MRAKFLRNSEAIQTGEMEQAASANVMDALHSDHASARAEAAGAAQGLALTLKAVADKKRLVEETMEALAREIRASRRRKRTRLGIGLTVVTLLVTLMIYAKSFGAIYWVFQIGGGWWAADKAVGKRREAAAKLREAGDPRAVGVLAVALRDGDAEVRSMANNTLLTLLPRVRANHAAFITPDQMEALLRIAYQSNGGLLQIALLKGLEQIGDARAIPAVEHLRNSADWMVQEAAEACLPFVQERARIARESATLLRASSAGAIAAKPDELLRPAQAAAPTPKEQLLRPAQETEEDAPTSRT